MTFKGRVLIEIRAKQHDQPVFKIQDIKKEDKNFHHRLDTIIKRLTKSGEVHELHEESEDEFLDDKSNAASGNKGVPSAKKKKAPDAITL